MALFVEEQSIGSSQISAISDRHKCASDLCLDKLSAHAIPIRAVSALSLLEILGEPRCREAGMKSSDLVAALSVLVAGVISPVIAMLTVRWQVSRTVDSDLAGERRRVLDEAIVELARFMRATGQTRAMWRHGRFDEDEEARDRTRSAKGVGCLAGVGGTSCEGSLC
jgi:hypothetical protein